MKQMRKVKTVPAALLIAKMREKLFLKEQENPLEEHFSEARQEFMGLNFTHRKVKEHRIKPAEIIAYTKELELLCKSILNL